MRNKIVTFGGAFAALMAPTSFAFAAVPPATFGDIGALIGFICTMLGWLFTVLFVIALIMLVYAAFQFLTAGGDEEKTGSARKTLTYAVIGLVIAFAARGIILVIANLFSAGASGAPCV